MATVQDPTYEIVDGHMVKIYRNSLGQKVTYGKHAPFIWEATPLPANAGEVRHKFVGPRGPLLNRERTEKMTNTELAQSANALKSVVHQLEKEASKPPKAKEFHIVASGNGFSVRDSKEDWSLPTYTFESLNTALNHIRKNIVRPDLAE